MQGVHFFYVDLIRQKSYNQYNLIAHKKQKLVTSCHFRQAFPFIGSTNV